MHLFPSQRAENIMIINEHRESEKCDSFCYLSGRCRSSVIKSNKMKPQCNAMAHLSLCFLLILSLCQASLFLFLSHSQSVTWNEFYLFFRWIVCVNIDSKRHSIAMSAYHWNDSRLNENHISHGKHSVRVIWYDLVVLAIWTSDIEQRAHELSKEHAVSIRTKYAHFVCTAHTHTQHPN